MTGIIHSITQTLRSNLRQGGLAIALVAIVLLFAVLTDGQILSAQNVSNIIVQNAYVLVLAIGMLFAILMADIDLSVGSVVALTGAVAGVAAAGTGAGSAWAPWGAGALSVGVAEALGVADAVGEAEALFGAAPAA